MIALLWSINERLAGGQGLAVEPLGTEWIEDLMQLALEEARKRENSDLEDALDV